MMFVEQFEVVGPPSATYSNYVIYVLQVNRQLGFI
jgi:hypothetical protein